MTERPIPFRDWEVRAILKGDKTQTRRKMKVQPHPDSIVTVEHYNQTVIDRHGDMQPGPEIFGAHWDDGERGLRCPYGAPGDTLWVREGFAVQPELWADNHGPQPIHYTADCVVGFAGEKDYRGIEDYRSKPSIHMPRWASRLTLEIKSVHVERLQDISEDNARAEGWPGPITETGFPIASPLAWFANVWTSINGPGTWEANPWVWVIKFERVKL